MGSSSVGVFDFVFEDFAALLPRPLSLPFPLLFALSGFSCFSSAINSFSFSLRSTLSSSARFGSSFMGFTNGAHHSVSVQKIRTGRDKLRGPDFLVRIFSVRSMIRIFLSEFPRSGPHPDHRPDQKNPYRKMRTMDRTILDHRA